MAESEIARLRRQIELECESMKLGMTGYAVIAKHKAITNKYNRLGAYKEQLTQLVGEPQATGIMAEVYIQVMKE